MEIDYSNHHSVAMNCMTSCTCSVITLPMCRYKLMTSCWERDPNVRPSFTELVQVFDKLLSLAHVSQHNLTLAKIDFPGHNRVICKWLPTRAQIYHRQDQQPIQDSCQRYPYTIPTCTSVSNYTVRTSSPSATASDPSMRHAPLSHLS